MDVKRSFYTVYSKPVDEENNRVYFSTRTNSVLTIPKIIHDCLKTGTFEELSENVLQALLDTKLLVPKEEDELLSIINENEQGIQESDQMELYEVIQPSAMCQLACYYCGQDHKKVNLTDNLLQKIVDRIKLKVEKGNYKKLKIGWFGGEPLMGLPQMRVLSSALITLANEFKLEYSAALVTNGLSLKENIFKELTTELKVKEIEITLDGLKEHHDSHRYTKNNGESFDLIYSNLLSIANLPDFDSYDCIINIRCNVDKKNVSSVSPLIRKLAEDNLHTKINRFYTAGIYSWGNDAHKGAHEKEDYAKLEIIWKIELIALGFKVSEIPARKKKVCMSLSKDSEVYDSYGNVFNCTETPLVPLYKESDYLLESLSNTESKTNPRKFTDWNQEILNNKFDCTSCNMLPVCGGACPKSWHEDMRACPPAKFNMQDRLMISSIIAKSSNIQERNENLLKYKEVLHSEIALQIVD